MQIYNGIFENQLFFSIFLLYLSMRKNFYSFVFLALGLLGLQSCQISAPTFKNLGSWQVSNVSTSNVTLSNTAYFHNPNKIDGIKLQNVTVDVMTNGRKLGTITNPAGLVTIPKSSDFSIPLSIQINPADLLGNITDLIGLATGKTIDLRCIGNVGVRYSIFNKKITIDQTLPVNISAIK